MIMDGVTGTHAVHQHMRRLNIATLIIGALAVVGAEMLAIIRIKVNFVVHITFAQICFWSVMFYQFLHIVLTWYLSRYWTNEDQFISPYKAYFKNNKNLKYRKYLPTNNKELALLSWFCIIFIFTATCLVAFTIEQSGGQFQVMSQFEKETNILEWLGVFWSFLYFLGYSVLFYRHAIEA